MAAPVPLSASAKKGVIVGMSFSSLPNAPGAPFAQSGTGSLTWACNCIAKESERADAKRVFMVYRGPSLRRLATVSTRKSAAKLCTARQGVGTDRRKIIGPRKTTGALIIFLLYCLPHNFKVLARDGVVGIDA